MKSILCLCTCFKRDLVAVVFLEGGLYQFVVSYKPFFQRNNRIWCKGLTFKAPSGASHQTRWYNQKNVNKMPVPQNFSWIENYTLMWLALYIVVPIYNPQHKTRADIFYLDDIILKFSKIVILQFSNSQIQILAGSLVQKNTRLGNANWIFFKWPNLDLRNFFWTLIDLRNFFWTLLFDFHRFLNTRSNLLWFQVKFCLGAREFFKRDMWV